MGKVSLNEKTQFRENLRKLLKENNSERIKDFAVQIQEKVQTLVDQGIDPKTIKLQFWIIPKKGRPADGDPNNHHVKTKDTFTLDINLLSNAIIGAINPVYDQDDTLIELNQQILNKKTLKIFTVCNILLQKIQKIQQYPQR